MAGGHADPLRTSDLRLCKVVYDSWSYIIDSYRMQLEDTRASGLHKLWYPGIRDRSTWGKFGAHGEHGDVFLFSNLGAL